TTEIYTLSLHDALPILGFSISVLVSKALVLRQAQDEGLGLILILSPSKDGSRAPCVALPSGADAFERLGLARQAAGPDLLDRVTPEAFVVLELREHVAELRDHLLREQLRRIHALLLRHVSDMHEAEDVADVQRLAEFLHALAHRFRRAGDDMALFRQLLPAQIGVPALGRRVLRQRAG